MPRADSSELETLLQYKFLNQDLLQKALRDPSFTNEPEGAGMADNTTLAFLGDAVLELTVRHDLMKPAPAGTRAPPSSQKVTVGMLSESADKVVNNALLATLARKLSLGAHIQLGKGSEATRDNVRVLSRAFEAVLGAILLDADYGQASRILRRLLAPAAAPSPAKTVAAP